MLWQLVPTESAVLEPIDLQDGAQLLGRGQRASPGIAEECVPKLAARIHTAAGRVQITAMSNSIRVWRNDQPQKLGRGQSALLQIGDTVDLSSNADFSAPASDFTYMLAESLFDDLPSETAPADSSIIKVQHNASKWQASVWPQDASNSMSFTAV